MLVLWEFGMVSTITVSKLLYRLGAPFDLFASEATLVRALGFLRHASICKAYGTGLHSQQHSQRAFICPKSTMETPEQCVKSVQS